MAEFVLVPGAWLGAWAWDERGAGAKRLTEAAVMERSIGELAVPYIKCLLDSPEPSTTVAELLRSERWRLVTMDTGHWPMFSQPRELARILLKVEI
jgi:hypothetical protein